MTPTAYIVGMLTDNAESLGIEESNICAFMIDDDLIDHGKPIVVVSENAAGSHDHGNNNILGTLRRIQIEFYYPRDFDGDMELIESRVKGLLHDNNIRCYSDAGHILAPDNLNITNTLHFNYMKYERN